LLLNYIVYYLIKLKNELAADILQVFSTVPRNVNFIEHTGYLGWKE